jgi:hypothetical protein
MSLAARSGGGGGRPRRYVVDRDFTEEQNSVLLEVFKSNLELARSLESIGGSIHSGRAMPAGDAGAAPPGSNGPAPPAPPPARQRPSEPPPIGDDSDMQ